MKPNIVLILTDQWRAQATGYAGDPNVRTPHLDALAQRSLNFVNAISVCPVCTPARSALLTGRYPTTTGMFLNDLYLPAEELCLAEAFGSAGYDTAYIGKWHVDGHGRGAYIPRERRQGFDYWKVLECTHDYMHSHYYAGDDPTQQTWDGYDAYAQTKDAQDYIRAHAEGDRPFFLFVGFGGPHFPHNNAPPDLLARYRSIDLQLRPNVTADQKQLTMKELPGYYAHCTAIDRCVGDLFQTVQDTGIFDDTIFIFMSDHGDMHGSHGRRSYRKQLPWDESLCVPFLCHYPQVHQRGRAVRTPLNITDVFPTLCTLAGIEIPATIEGEDMSALFTDRNVERDRAALFMSVCPFGDLDFKAYRGVRTDRYSYVRDSDGPWLLYDNQTDPYQMSNLVNAPDHTALRARLETELQRQLQRNSDDFPDARAAVERWGYIVDEMNIIGYHNVTMVQSPGPDHKKPISLTTAS